MKVYINQESQFVKLINYWGGAYNFLEENYMHRQMGCNYKIN